MEFNITNKKYKDLEEAKEQEEDLIPDLLSEFTVYNTTAGTYIQNNINQFENLYPKFSFNNKVFYKDSNCDVLNEKHYQLPPLVCDPNKTFSFRINKIINTKLAYEKKETSFPEIKNLGLQFFIEQRQKRYINPTLNIGNIIEDKNIITAHTKDSFYTSDILFEVFRKSSTITFVVNVIFGFDPFSFTTFEIIDILEDGISSGVINGLKVLRGRFVSPLKINLSKDQLILYDTLLMEINLNNFKETLEEGKEFQMDFDSLLFCFPNSLDDLENRFLINLKIIESRSEFLIPRNSITLDSCIKNIKSCSETKYSTLLQNTIKRARIVTDNSLNFVLNINSLKEKIGTTPVIDEDYLFDMESLLSEHLTTQNNLEKFKGRKKKKEFEDLKNISLRKKVFDSYNTDQILLNGNNDEWRKEFEELKNFLFCKKDRKLSNSVFKNDDNWGTASLHIACKGITKFQIENITNDNVNKVFLILLYKIKMFNDIDLKIILYNFIAANIKNSTDFYSEAIKKNHLLNFNIY